jgi:GDP-L-fucose synthase
MDRSSRIFIAGHRGLVGSAIVRALRARGFERLITRGRDALDLTDRVATDALFRDEKPEYVIVAAAKVGGIHANNSYPADFIRINLEIQTNLIDAAHRHGVTKLLTLGSSCIYPKFAPQPIREEYLMTGPLEPTNDAYAIAKIAALIACKSYNRQHGTNFVAAMPTNVYGPGDNFDLETAHVLPAMIRRFHEARTQGKSEVVLWGTGRARREFLYVDDLADAVLFMMEEFDAQGDDIFANVGVGLDIGIAELAAITAEIVGYTGELVWNSDMPDGTPRKLLDMSRLHGLGWRARTELRAGIRTTYDWYCANLGPDARLRRSVA